MEVAADHGLAILIATAVFIGAWSLGRLIERGARFRFERRLPEGEAKSTEWSSPAAVSAGLGAMTLLVAGLGFSGLLNRVSMAGMLAVSLVPFPLILRNRLRDRRKPSESGSAPVPLLLIIGFCLLSIWALAPALVNIFTPPTEMDELIYHLALPRTYLRHHRIIELPYNTMSYNTLSVHMIYTMTLAIGPDVSVKLIHLGLGLLSAALVYRLAARFAGRGAGLLGALLFLSHPQVIYVSGIAYIDLGVTAFFLAAVEGYLDWQETRERTALYRCGFMLGMSFAAKLMALYFIVPMLLVMAWDEIRSESRPGLKAYITAACIFSLPFLPWVIRSAVWTGDPVYPFLKMILMPESVAAHTYKASALGSYQTAGMGRSALDYVLVPWNLLMHGKQSHPHFYGALHPAIIVLLIVGSIRIIKEQTLRRLLFVAIAGAYAWSLGSQFMRYFLPGAALLTALAAGAFLKDGPARDITRARKALSWAAAAVIIAPSLLSPLYVWPRFSRAFPCFTGAQTRDNYLEKRLPYYKMDQYINENLPPDAKLLCWFEARTYYIDRDVIIHHPEVYDLSLYEIARHEGEQELEEWFAERGITHVLHHRPNLRNYHRILGEDSESFQDIRNAVENMEAFLKKRGNKLHWSAGLWLYELKED
jgi:hypothetical protein